MLSGLTLVLCHTVFIIMPLWFYHMISHPSVGLNSSIFLRSYTIWRRIPWLIDTLRKITWLNHCRRASSNILFFLALFLVIRPLMILEVCSNFSCDCMAPHHQCGSFDTHSNNTRRIFLKLSIVYETLWCHIRLYFILLVN